LIASLTAFGPRPAVAEAEPDYRNLVGLEAAEDYANALIEGGGPVVVVHFGETVPEELSWVLRRLERKGVEFELKRVTLETLRVLETESRATTVSGAAPTVLNYRPEQPVARSTPKNAVERALFFARRLTRLPGGLTFTFQLKRSANEKRNEFIGAATLSGMATVVTVLSTYGVMYTTGNQDLHPFVAGLAYGAYVGTMKYFERIITQLKNQVKVVRIDDTGALTIKPSNWFIYLTAFAESAIPNMLLFAGTYGLSAALVPENIQTKLALTAAYVYGRAPFDRRLFMRMPRSSTPTTIQSDFETALSRDAFGVTAIAETPQAWTFKRYYWTNYIWDISVAQVKNWAVQFPGNAMVYIFGGLGTGGLVANLWRDRISLGRNVMNAFSQSARVERAEAAARCQTIFLRGVKVEQARPATLDEMIPEALAS